MGFGRDDVFERNFGGPNVLMRDLVVSWEPKNEP